MKPYDHSRASNEIVAVIAAAIAEGSSTISGIHHLERGYHRPAEQFAALGLPIGPAD